LDVKGAKELIRDLELDVVIFPDIGMDAMTYFLARER
jgi:predicted Fe-Mo cluster-binding NifX family protein